MVRENQMNEMEEIVSQFVVESRENLDQLERDLVELEKSPTSRGHLASIFRMIHSIKGATGFLDFPKLGAVAHVGEGLLSRMRDGILIVNPQITTGLLAMVDCMREILSNIEKTRLEGEVDYTAIVQELARLREDKRPEKARPTSSALAPVPADSPAARSDPADDLTAAAAKEQPESALRRAEEAVVDASPDRRESGLAAGSSSSVRVDVKQLDKLMDLVGELVLTRNELLQLSSLRQDSVPLSTSQRLNSITTELQDGIMKVRMQPIDNVWSTFPRVVRDLALRGKRVRLEMKGKETELDKTLLEAIKDPLTHLVRNAIDHGLEAPDVRIAAGKSAEGRLTLRASHEGGQVEIEISDDGAGIDLIRVKRKAVERGLVPADQAQLMDDQEATELIFLPGFSTAEKITSTSGRGVGMDVVKTNIEKIGGKVSVQSKFGVGTTVKIRIPLTLAIMPALVVTASGGQYAIPQVSVLELLRLEGAGAGRGIEKIQNASVYRLRGDLLPLIGLGAELQMEARTPDEQVMKGKEVANIVVLQAGDRKFGLVVDEVNNTQEIVVKALGRHLRGISTFAGATIMGNGRVVLILDVLGLALRAHVVSELREEQAAKNSVPLREEVVEKQALLLFSGPDDARMAIPLSQVTRLEEFPPSCVERLGNRNVVQYRGEILSLVDISALLPERRLRARRSPAKAETDTKIHAIVYSKDGCSVGLVVDNILDTIEEGLANLRPASRQGALASVVIQGRVTEILDLDVICAHAASISLPKQILMEAEA
jgi:two-component system chemotaxis sensor kinase CheA